MSKVTYAGLKLKTDTSVNIVDFDENNKIEVLQYLPIEEKYSLINVTLQEAKEGNIYNPIKLNMFFDLYVVMMYTNITFTDKQRENPFKLYDCLESNGIIDKVVSAIPEGEYEFLYNNLNETMENLLKYNNTVAGAINNIFETLPGKAEEMQKILDSFDKDKYTEVINFAKAANGGRDI